MSNIVWCTFRTTGSLWYASVEGLWYQVVYNSSKQKLLHTLENEEPSLQGLLQNSTSQEQQLFPFAAI